MSLWQGLINRLVIFGIVVAGGLLLMLALMLRDLVLWLFW